jgi:hypothetical protein
LKGTIPPSLPFFSPGIGHLAKQQLVNWQNLGTWPYQVKLLPHNQLIDFTTIFLDDSFGTTFA